MKLRIIKIDSDKRMDGEFVVQKKNLWMWDDLYYDPDKDVLSWKAYVGRRGIIKIAKFDDYHEALRLAQIFKQNYGKKRVIRDFWPV